jgi:hypothetical protein
MMYGLVFWFVAAQLAMADRKSRRMAKMVGTKASNSIASRSGRIVSIRTGDSSSSSMPTTNHLHWVYAIASHHPKSFDQDVEIVDDAIQELVMNLFTDDWGYSYAEVPCQENSSALGYLKCSAFAYFFDSTANLDPLGPALVDLISDLSDQYRGQFSVTWDLLPETPNAADYTYDIVVLDYQGDDDNISNETMFDAWSLVDEEIYQDIQANVEVDWTGGEECMESPCPTNDVEGDSVAAEEDHDDGYAPSLDEVLCYRFSCFVYTVEKNMGQQVQTSVQLAVLVVDEQYDWFNVTFVPDDGPDVVHRTNPAAAGKLVAEAVASG